MTSRSGLQLNESVHWFRRVCNSTYQEAHLFLCFSVFRRYQQQLDAESKEQDKQRWVGVLSMITYKNALYKWFVNHLTCKTDAYWCDIHMCQIMLLIKEVLIVHTSYKLLN